MHEPCISRGDCYHSRGGRKRFELHGTPATLEGCAKGGRVGGHITGRKNVESGHLSRILELPQTKAARRETGRKAVESGHLARIRELPQTKAAQREVGRKAVESGHLARINELSQSKAAQRENGRKVGRKAVESGHLQHISSLGGRKAVESGQLARISNGVLSTADGILFRSQTEAAFYCVIKELGGEPTYEPGFIKMPDGTSYMPDFVLGKSVLVLGLPANVPIELKPSRDAFNLKNVEKALKAGAIVVYWDELVEGSF